MTERTLVLRTQLTVSMIPATPHRSSEQAVVRTVTDVLIPPMSEAIVRVSVPQSFRGAMAILEPHGLVQQRAFAVAKSLVSDRRYLVINYVILPVDCLT